MADRYGWIIDVDHLASGDSNDAGTMGPHRISPEIETRLKAGEGRQFRMYDSELCYSGRILTPSAPDGGGRDDFGPLDDFGTPNAGCTVIRYFNAAEDAWKEL